MQAKGSAVATSPTAGPARRQVEWARRENDRRRRAYAAQAEAWRRHEDHLVRLRIEATGFLGCTQPRAGLPTELDHDEVVYRILPAAELVEAAARHLTGLPAPGLTVAVATVAEPGRALPAGLRVVDAGMAVVTDRRVVFAGRDGRREWTYAGMLGPGHHPDLPITLLHGAQGRRPAGLRIPAATAVNTRFYLTLAFATATGARAAIVSQLDALLAAHRAARPTPPPAVTPEQAPLPLPRPGRVTAAAAVLVVVLLAALTTGPVPAAPADLPYRAQASTGGSAAPPNTDRATGSADPSPPTDPPDGPGSRPAPATTAIRPVARAAAGEPVTQPVTGRGAVPATPGTATTPAPTAPSGPTATPTAPAPTAPSGSTATPPPATDPPTTEPAPSTAPSPAPPARSACPELLRLPLVVPLLCSLTGP
ncbi:hypothetical protein AB0C02_25795 [Micromonospora sp. NPDC048999]|uniref:hypothetical protein n=1 Tax=Micromonospora sp. NPDC048999 TaxID=3155391 RepID=UPI0033DA264A